ncbi:ATP-dependent DNA helicase [Enterococcus faecium]|uniref:ATP-dependent DNA helicase n=1 Tax=Enterococcus faecium TaxID=1352 RepID=UPI000F512DC2|nr:ATP-dependent DNA helicase [Enterococcus faecium]ROX63908.1 ATP-dependent DNA helicase [Enterococcus faecium]ROX65840.1 ATP-dependent DNA helicase [Enterococcus faecium]ROY76929.1 ATP-dependent DNA helicase [Enterococcus faecium]ROY81525.1 ATP-dependent DNA helicase [Enterococcus faecium]ROY82292.1 ATP-dependent DNA helicase [Enterococcus faecium]
MKDITIEILEYFEEKLPNIFQKKNSTRQHQVQMALDVGEFLFNERKKIMFLEAPVGTGKSLGVLIPSSIYTREKRNNILYVTSTINLQNQIYDVDSVTLAQLSLINSNQKLLAQGKSNYTCRSCFFENMNRFNYQEKLALSDFFKNCKTGLFSELEKLYPEFSKDKRKFLAMDNLSGNCYDPLCRGHNHRKEYKKNYKLVITNHNQLNQSYLNEKKGFSPILNFKNNILIIDEAHSFKENFLSSLEQVFTLNKFRQLKITKNRKDFFSILKKLSKIKKKYVKENSETSSMRYNIKGEDKQYLKQLKDILEENYLQLTLNQRYDNPDAELVSSASEYLADFMNHRNYKCWIQFDKGDLTLHFVDLNFNKQFRNYITYLSAHSKIIFMSGTLTTEDYETDLNTNWSLTPKEYRYTCYPSVFSLKKQAIVYIPKSYPSPNSPKHILAVQKDLPKIINTMNGGSLILCTSNEYVTLISEYLKKTNDIKENVYVQGESNTQFLSNKFREDTNSILVGSGSFFVGFSVEGKSLNKLILPKLPYPVPDDPYIELISQGYDRQEIYNEFIHPMMLTKLEQGLGRLIRSKSDFGIITILDSRAQSKNNVKLFIEKLGYHVTSDITEIIAFTNNIHKKNVGTALPIYDKEKLKLPRIILHSLSKERKKTAPRKQIKTDSKDNELQTWLKSFVAQHKNDTEFPASRIPYKQCKNPRDAYQKAINFCHQKGIDQKIVAETFPFYSDSFSRISPTVSGPVITISTTKEDD